jgi:hypothetical protein
MQNYIQVSSVASCMLPELESKAGYQVVVERVFADPPYMQFCVDAGADALVAKGILTIYLENQKAEGYDVLADSEGEGRYLVRRGSILFHVWIDPALPAGVLV